MIVVVWCTGTYPCFNLFSQGLDTASADVREVFKEIQDLEKAAQSNQVIMFVYSEILISCPFLFCFVIENANVG